MQETEKKKVSLPAKALRLPNSECASADHPASMSAREVIEIESSIDDSLPQGILKLRKCSQGHSVLTRDDDFQCEFCRDLLRSYREYASRRGGTLVSRVPDRVLIFKCHRKHHAEFSLFSKRLGSLWCPQCNPDKSRIRLMPTASQSSHIPSTSSDPRVEEVKRHQANLLHSAKILYKISTTKKVFPPSFVKIFADADRDLIDYPNIPRRQCILVRALLSCPSSWSIVAQGLEVELSLGPEKLYRMAAKLVHPDKCNHPRAGDAFKVLSSLL